MKRTIQIVLLTVSVFLFSCTNSTTVFENTEGLIASAKESARSIDAETLKTVLETETNLQVVDCREANVFVEGHIPGAINIPRGVLEFSSLLSNRRLTTIIVGNDMGSAALAAQSLKKLKYSKCYWVDCKWNEWTANNPDMVEKGFEGLVAENEVKVESSGGCGE